MKGKSVYGKITEKVPPADKGSYKNRTEHIRKQEALTDNERM